MPQLTSCTRMILSCLERPRSDSWLLKELLVIICTIVVKSSHWKTNLMSTNQMLKMSNICSGIFHSIFYVCRFPFFLVGSNSAGSLVGIDGQGGAVSSKEMKYNLFSEILWIILQIISLRKKNSANRWWNTGQTLLEQGKLTKHAPKLQEYEWAWLICVSMK